MAFLYQCQSCKVVGELDEFEENVQCPQCGGSMLPLKSDDGHFTTDDLDAPTIAVSREQVMDGNGSPIDKKPVKIAKAVDLGFAGMLSKTSTGPYKRPDAPPAQSTPVAKPQTQDIFYQPKPPPQYTPEPPPPQTPLPPPAPPPTTATSAGKKKFTISKPSGSTQIGKAPQAQVPKPQQSFSTQINKQPPPPPPPSTPPPKPLPNQSTTQKKLVFQTSTNIAQQQKKQFSTQIPAKQVPPQSPRPASPPTPVPAQQPSPAKPVTQTSVPLKGKIISPPKNISQQTQIPPQQQHPAQSQPFAEQNFQSQIQQQAPKQQLPQQTIGEDLAIKAERSRIEADEAIRKELILKEAQRIAEEQIKLAKEEAERKIAEEKALMAKKAAEEAELARKIAEEAAKKALMETSSFYTEKIQEEKLKAQQEAEERIKKELEKLEAMRRELEELKRKTEEQLKNLPAESKIEPNQNRTQEQKTESIQSIPPQIIEPVQQQNQAELPPPHQDTSESKTNPITSEQTQNSEKQTTTAIDLSSLPEQQQVAEKTTSTNGILPQTPSQSMPESKIKAQSEETNPQNSTQNAENKEKLESNAPPSAQPTTNESEKKDDNQKDSEPPAQIQNTDQLNKDKPEQKSEESKTKEEDKKESQEPKSDKKDFKKPIFPRKKSKAPILPGKKPPTATTTSAKIAKQDKISETKSAIAKADDNKKQSLSKDISTQASGITHSGLIRLKQKKAQIIYGIITAASLVACLFIIWLGTRVRRLLEGNRKSNEPTHQIKIKKLEDQPKKPELKPLQAEYEEVLAKARRMPAGSLEDIEKLVKLWDDFINQHSDMQNNEFVIEAKKQRKEAENLKAWFTTK